MATKSSKHEYNKPQLKSQIEAAMAAFLKSGRSVERVPTVMAAEAPTSRGDKSEAQAGEDEGAEGAEAAEAPETPDSSDASL